MRNRTRFRRPTQAIEHLFPPYATEKSTGAEPVVDVLAGNIAGGPNSKSCRPRVVDSDHHMTTSDRYHDDGADGEMLLLQPCTLGDLQLPNRIVMAPLTRTRATVPGQVPNDLMR